MKMSSNSPFANQFAPPPGLPDLEVGHARPLVDTREILDRLHDAKLSLDHGDIPEARRHVEAAEELLTR